MCFILYLYCGIHEKNYTGMANLSSKPQVEFLLDSTNSTLKSRNLTTLQFPTFFQRTEYKQFFRLDHTTASAVSDFPEF